MRMPMSCFLLALALGAGAPVARAEPGDTTPTPIAVDKPVAPEPVPFGFDILPYAGTSSDGAERPRVVSLNLIGGLSGGLEALELGFVFNIDQGLVSGLQLAGALNVVSADVVGFQGAGAVNVVTGDVRGAQSAPLNYTHGRVAGGQLGVLNIAGRVAGLQTGVLDVASGPVLGLQLGVTNVAGGGVSGAQLGVLNVASEPVHGLQLGVLNVAPSADVGIGVLSIYWDGWTDGDVMVNESGMLLAGVRHGSGATYNVYYLGSRLSSDGSDFVAGLGFGGRMLLGAQLELAIDVTNLTLAHDGRYDRELNVTSLRPHVSWRANPRLALYLGPTLNLEVADAALASEVEPLLGDWAVNEREGEVQVRMWVGFVAGMRIF